MPSFTKLLKEVRACTICAAHLNHPPRPVIQLHPQAKILIAGQAPGRRVQESGIAFDDASGKRLRDWMGISDEDFYDPKKIAILPMGFCYPGSGKSGDKPPRPECAPAWREQLLELLPTIELMLVIGKYAQDYHLIKPNKTITQNIRDWKLFWPDKLPLPHPSPRNNIWLKRNLWFETEVLPVLKKRVAEILI